MSWAFSHDSLPLSGCVAPAVFQNPRHFFTERHEVRHGLSVRIRVVTSSCSKGLVSTRQILQVHSGSAGAVSLRRRPWTSLLCRTTGDCDSESTGNR